MTEIGMRVARALSKRNLTRDHVSIELVAKIVDEVAKLPLLCDLVAQMTGSEIIEKATSEAAKRAGTF